MFKESIDVKEFGEKLLTKVLYDSFVESTDECISIMLKNRGNHSGKIDTSKWEPFLIRAAFSVVKESRLTKADMRDGNINFIGASAINNGITAPYIK